MVPTLGGLGDGEAALAGALLLVFQVIAGPTALAIAGTDGQQSASIAALCRLDVNPTVAKGKL